MSGCMETDGKKGAAPGECAEVHPEAKRVSESGFEKDDGYLDFEQAYREFIKSAGVGSSGSIIMARSCRSSSSILGSVTGANREPQDGALRRQQYQKYSTDDVALYSRNHKFHLTQPDINRSTTENEPNDDLNESELTQLTLSDHPATTTTAISNILIANPPGMDHHPIPLFNRYPAPMFIKTVMSARANLLKRGLAEGAARRTRVNNDLRDELTRIIQFTAEQRELQMRQKKLSERQSANRVAIGRENNSVKTPELIKKKVSQDSHVTNPDHSGNEIWPSASPSRLRRPSHGPREKSGLIQIPNPTPCSDRSRSRNFKTPPNSAAPTTLGIDARSTTPGVKYFPPPAPRKKSPAQHIANLAGIETLQKTPSQKQERRFIACVVSQNFAMKLLETPRSESQKRFVTSKGAGGVFRRRKSRSQSRSFEPNLTQAVIHL